MRTEQGFAVPLALLVIVALGLIGAATAYMSAGDTNISAVYASANRTSDAAAAGIEHGVVTYGQKLDSWTPIQGDLHDFILGASWPVQGKIDGFDYTVTVKRDSFDFDGDGDLEAVSCLSNNGGNGGSGSNSGVSGDAGTGGSGGGSTVGGTPDSTSNTESDSTSGEFGYTGTGNQNSGQNTGENSGQGTSGQGGGSSGQGGGNTCVQEKSTNPSGTITVTFKCTMINVISKRHEISNVVIEFEDGTTEKFDGQSGNNRDYAGTGANEGKTIVSAWVKAASNKSGDCPGCGEKIGDDESGNSGNGGGAGSTNAGGNNPNANGGKSCTMNGDDQGSPVFLLTSTASKGTFEARQRLWITSDPSSNEVSRLTWIAE